VVEQAKSATSEKPEPEAAEPVRIDLSPEAALKGLLAVEPTITAEDMARKHGLDGLSLRDLLRANPSLTPGHRDNDDYQITPAIERAIMAHPAFQGVKKR